MTQSPSGEPPAVFLIERRFLVSVPRFVRRGVTVAATFASAARFAILMELPSLVWRQHARRVVIVRCDFRLADSTPQPAMLKK